MKRWLITGVSSGLGKALASAALARGDQVAGTVRTAADAASFETLGRGGTAIIADLTKAGAADQIAERANTALGGVDILVNNAGSCIAGAIEEVAPAEEQRLFALNVHAPMALTRAVLPAMRQQGHGRIINIGSFAGVQGLPYMGIYSATKAALAGFSEALSAELSPLGVAVTLVEPTGFRTEFGGRSMAYAALEIPAYADLRDRIAAGIARSNGRQRNDPSLGAAALLALADMPEPPVRLALGVDALARITAALGTRLASYAAHAELGGATAFELPQSGEQA